MSSDHQFGTVFDCRQGFTLFFGLLFSGEPNDTDAERFQPGNNLFKVLFSQNFRRRHKRRLVACINRLAGGKRRNDGFTASDISLNQSVHGAFAAERFVNIFPDSNLGLCQLKGQGMEKFCCQRVVVAFAQRHQRSFVHIPHFTRFLQRNLLSQKLIEFQPLPSRIRSILQRTNRSAGLRMMQRINRFRKSRKVQFITLFFGQEVRNIHVH